MQQVQAHDFPCQRIGLCGSHRTGKTTLAEVVSREIGLAFVRTSTSRVFADHGLDPSQPMDFKTRLWIQHKVVEAAEADWNSQAGAFITDRTPVDMIAYTLADIQGDTEVDFTALAEYLSVCFSVTNARFSTLVIIQPGIPLIFEPGKAALNRAYIEHLSALILGLCHDHRVTCRSVVMPQPIIAIEERVRYIASLVHAAPGTMPSDSSTVSDKRLPFRRRQQIGEADILKDFLFH